MFKKIEISGASEHNLKNIDVSIDHNVMTVVTGVSGSGKSSLVYDVICSEGQRRYFESFSTHARQYLKQLKHPEVAQITGLPPAISVDQKSVTRNPRSTVGTLSEIYDYLRLLFARLGKTQSLVEKKIERRLFSFNSPYGACSICKGLGVEDHIDPSKLIEDENKTLREGALVITTPSGYIIYSQVTMDVLNQVCNAHSFNVDIKWKDLTPEQKKIILYGSDIIKIPFGKHTLESRMKWSGITAKPREEGYYKGIVPVMEEILHRDRNKNILRFVSTTKCSACRGKRLNKEALSIKFKETTIAEFASLSLAELHHYFESIEFTPAEEKVGLPVREEILKRSNLLIRLGLGYLNLERESTTLSGGEAQRIRLANQVAIILRGRMFVLDEPSIGLHPKDTKKLLSILDELTDNGNTVLVVEHDEDTIRHANRIIDIGPKAGIHGGELLYCGSTEKFLAGNHENSITHNFLTGKRYISLPKIRRKGNLNYLEITGASQHNLKNINVKFPLGVLNVVTGVSGAGKSSLVHDIIANKLKQKLHNTSNLHIGKHKDIYGVENILKVIEINQSPIGRTPRSNPATYTKLFDHIRDLYASLPKSKEKAWKKGRFSFNNKGGRCETCHGAGVLQVGMHFLGNVDITCNECFGKRFNNETLSVKYKEKSIYDVLEMSVDEACIFFKDKAKLIQYISTLQSLGLGYITLGQPATTLSGGEAQRVKLAAELSRTTKGHTLYILDEPTAGLHFYDIEILLRSLNDLVDNDNTVIIIEHHSDIIKSADHITDIGPGSGKNGGNVIATGTPEEIIKNERSIIGKELKYSFERKHYKSDHKATYDPSTPIEFRGISTHNLKNIDVSIPVNKLSVISGVSGSGKSSLAFDTIFAEGQKLYLDSFSNYLRSFIKQNGESRFEEVKGMTPAIAIDQRLRSQNPRSTLGTVTEIYDYYRLMFSRAGTSFCPKCNNILQKGLCTLCGYQGEEKLSASMFSFNHEQGACFACKGLGYKIVCDPDKLISNPELALGYGAMKGHKNGKFYEDLHGQYMAILSEVGKKLSIDYTLPWNELDVKARRIAMFGTENQNYDVVWKYKRKKREGLHRFSTEWKGFTTVAEEEYNRKHADRRGESMMPLMKNDTCKLCKGTRLKNEYAAVRFADITIADLSNKSVNQSISFFNDLEKNICDANILKVIKDILYEIIKRLEILNNIGLGYLTIDRRSNTLSGGESRRMHMAGQIVSGLSGITYVLDEPSIGLHYKDTEKLIQLLFKLRDNGNTVIVVEHDADIISRADHIIDLGPGAGKHGGKIIVSGNLDNIKSSKDSLTGKYLKKPIKFSMSERQLNQGINIKKAFANNLKKIDIEFPSGGITAITGVSGSGKSSLLFDVLYQSVIKNRSVNCESITGFDKFDNIIKVDQKLPGKSFSSNLLTYLDCFDTIRDIFAKLKNSKDQAFTKSDFSFNSKGGRCEICKGTGQIKVAMDFLSDVWLECEDCKGRRYKDYILNIQFNGRSIDQVLKLTVKEAIDFFKDQTKLLPYFNTLSKTGLNYLTLGQALYTFSGGELQRIKLASALVDKNTNKNLYLLDEPTTGLHFKDVETLLKLMNHLVDIGHSIIVTEHNQDIIRHSDYVIELGPEGGEKGGYLINVK